MRQPHDERDLRKRFAELRHEDIAQTPPFERPAPVARSHHWGRLAAAAAVAIITVTAVLWTIGSRAGQPPLLAVDLTRTVWESPTDFLLDTPGSELLRTVPTIRNATPPTGDVPDGGPLRRNPS